MSESKYCFIDLGGIRGKGKQAKISIEDKVAVAQIGWNVDNAGYVHGVQYTAVGIKNWFLHRYVWFLQYGVILPPTTQLDHIHNDPLNNARDNLRIATALEQAGNKRLRRNNVSGCAHISWMRKQKQWRGRIKYDGREVFRQMFDSIKEASNVTKAKHREIYGEFSHYEIDSVRFAKSVKFDLDRKDNPAAEYNLAAPRTFIPESERFLPQLDGTCKIKLSDNKGGFVYTLIDQVDVDAAKGYSWYIDKKGYVVGAANASTKRLRKGTQATVSLARLIMARVKGNAETKYSGGPTTDHIDGNKLNNCRKNLREASASQQSANTSRPATNTSGFKGISWAESQNKWRAQIKIAGKSKQYKSQINSILKTLKQDILDTSVINWMQLLLTQSEPKKCTKNLPELM